MIGRRGGSIRWREGPGTLLFILLSAVLAVGFHAEFVFRPDRMHFGSDMLDQGYQLRHFALEEIRAGRGLPLWNPFVYAGVPYLAILPGPLFYPTSLAYLILPLFRAIGWTFVFHTFAAGALAYVAGRTFGLRRWAAAVTGLAFMFTGYFASMLYGGHDGRMFAMALIPAAFACLERGLRTLRLAPFLGLGLVVALQIFTPHIQVMYYSSLALLAYAAFRLAERWLRGEEERAEVRRGVLRGTGYFILAFVAAVLIGAVQLLPTAALLEHAVRGTAGLDGYEFAASWAVPPQELSALFLPDLVGSLQSYWGANPFKLHTEYLGAVPVALATVGVLSARGDRRIWFLAGGSALGIAFALGEATPVHRIAYAVVPMVERFRGPVMMLAPVSFLVALLAGFGCQRILEAREGEGELPWIWIWALSTPFLFLGLGALLSPDGLLGWVRNGWFPVDHPEGPPADLAGTLRLTGGIVLGGWLAALGTGQAIARGRLPRWALGGVLLLLVLDLWRVDARYLETVEPGRALAAGPVVERLQEEIRPGERVWPLEGTFRPNELMLHRIPALGGSLNFRLEWYERLTGGPGEANLLRNPALWGLFDLRFLTARSELPTPLLRPEEVAEGIRLYETAAPPPHAFFPEEVTAVVDTSEALRETLALADPTRQAVVEIPAEEGSDREGASAPAGEGTARLVRWHPNEIVLEVSAEREGLLFLSEIHHPDWTAFVDDEEVRTRRVNTAFRGVVVPQGEHELRMEYRSGIVRAAAILTAMATAALLAALGILLWRNRSGDRPGGSEAP